MKTTIIIFSKTKEEHKEHKEHLKAVLERIRNAGLSLNKSKCKFMRESIELLGMKIEKGIVRLTDERVKTIRNFKEPSFIKELRSFLGLANYWRGVCAKFGSDKTPIKPVT